ncbi:MAG: MarR family winged helix-turn-helix transcriptional regulator [Vicinamibacterales bacterium]
MSSGLKDEIKQTRPFGSLQEEAALNIARTYALLDHSLAQALKPFDITPTQYNVLRILRGAGASGLCRNEIGERLIRRVPDVTRLLDRMEEAGLVLRERGGADRRYVTTRVSEDGLKLLANLEGKICEIHRTQLGHLDDETLRELIDLLTKVRARSLRRSSGPTRTESS